MHRAYITPIKYYRTMLASGSQEPESVCSFIVRISRDHLIPIDLITETELLFKKRVRNMVSVGTRLLVPNEDGASVIESFLKKTTAKQHLVSDFTYSQLGELLQQGSLPVCPENKSWCPRCYHEDLSNGFCYDRRSWAFLSGSYCRVHGCKLVDLCVNCGQRQPYLNEFFPIGYCDACGRFLGLEHYYVKAENYLSECVRTAVERFTAGDVSVLHECRDLTEQMLSHLGEQGLASRLGVNRTILGAYLSGTGKPAYGMCLRIFEEYDSMANRWTTPCDRPETPLREFETDFSSIVDLRAIREYLDRIISGEIPPALREEIAAFLGVSSSFLGIHFPSECSRVTILLRTASRASGSSDSMKQHLKCAIQEVKREGHQLKWESVLACLPTDVLKTTRARDIMKAYRDINKSKRVLVNR